ncbi:putative mitochondrial aaa protein [Phaeoacremonium minimum UCRPA7]|uniref:Putative mitochondrial aaa protein n=1 Tax=Phaeoacremonium minimum (strain UCR-PA7) TaxID=1286976 RepID=R8BM73_PHAM7|nr:putative mitochondrial aaa protein [Phaeoacremonium minimum UCRPA7]EOO00432.1 putative mitochondrial aaa protein [Phaeoacremonium minimum UCRPA7]
MIFSDLYKSPRSPLSKLRHPHLQHHQTPTEQDPDFDADLLSKDKTKQKEAVKRFLAQKVRNDWDFKWPAHNNAPELPAAEEPIITETASLAADKDIEGFLEVAIENEDDDITPVADEDAVVDSGEEADSETDSPYPVETLLPIAPPLLPPANPMRASITPALYISIYDKVVVHSLQPSCPINLGDMIRACVTGWKRDGEWPPRPSELPAVIAVRKKREKRDSVTSPSSARRMSFGFLNRGDKDEKDKDKDKEKPSEARRESSVAEDASSGKAFRRSIQKVLGIGHTHSNSNASANAGAVAVANGIGHGKEGGAGA